MTLPRFHNLETNMQGGTQCRVNPEINGSVSQTISPFPFTD